MKTKSAEVIQGTEEVLRAERRRRRWVSVVVVLALLVSIGTVAALRIRAVAMNHKKTIMICTYQVHQHDASCYDLAGNLICGYADYVVHTHDVNCYDDDGNLICTLPEIEEHTHTDACYDETQVLVCGLEESAGHVHDDSCYTSERGDLICGYEEHTHTDACYDEEGNLVCGYEEHVHTDDCYAWNSVLTCGLEEGEGAHTHTDACFETQYTLICDKPEVILHTHVPYDPDHPDADACYDEYGNLICGMLQVEAHQHTAECRELVDMTEEEVAAMNAANEEAETEHILITCEEDDVSPVSDTVDAEEAAAAASGEASEESEYTTLTYRGEDYTVTASYTAEACLADNVELRAEEIPQDSDEYAVYYRQLADYMAEEDDSALQGIRFFDIGFYVDGEEVEPLTQVDVSVVYDDAEDSQQQAGRVAHFTNGAVETIDTEPVEDENGQAVGYSFSSGSFSVYSGLFGAAPDVDNSFTVTWNLWGSSYVKTIYCVDTAGKELAVDKTDLTYTDQRAYSLSGSNIPTIEGYTFQAAHEGSITGNAATEMHFWSTNTVYLVYKNANDCSFTVDGSNGSQPIYSGYKSKSYNAQKGETVTLTADLIYGTLNSERYPVTAVGFYNVTTGQYYKVGDEYEVQDGDLFYVDWVGTDYDNYDGDGSDTIDTVDTSGFVHIDVWDFNDLFNTQSLIYSSGTWSRNLALDWGATPTGFVFNDYRDNVNGAGLGYAQGSDLTVSSVWTGGQTPYYNIMASSLSEDTLHTWLFNRNTIGAHYLGTGNYLLQYISDGEYSDCYSYTSTSNAASYQQSEQRFYVYETTQQVGSASTGFAPLNKGSGAQSNGENSGSKNTNYWFGLTMTVSFSLDSTSDKNAPAGTINQINGKDMMFFFSGDDDIWVYVDDELVLDLGGIHNRVQGYINFATGVCTIYNDSGTISSEPRAFSAGDHILTVYYLERGADQSNCTVRFRLQPQMTLGVQKVDAEDDDKLLQDAQFIIQKAENGSYYSYTAADGVKWVSDRSSATQLGTDSLGYLSFKGLSDPGSYKLIETQAPSNYQISIGEIDFEIYETGRFDPATGERILEAKLSGTYSGVTMDNANKMTISVADSHIIRQLQIRKTDMKDNPVSGVVFRLYEGGNTPAAGAKSVSNFDSITYLISDSGGNLVPAAQNADGSYSAVSGGSSVLQLKTGVTYYLQEIKVPTYVTIDAALIPIVVEDTDENGITIGAAYTGGKASVSGPSAQTVTEDGVTVTTYTYNMTVKNTAADPILRIYKTNEDGTEVLSGASYTLYRADDSGTETLKVGNTDVKVTKVMMGSSSDTGLFYCGYEVPDGTYYLQETAAPAGYLCSTEIVSFTVRYSSHADDNGISANKLTITYTDGVTGSAVSGAEAAAWTLKVSDTAITLPKISLVKIDGTSNRMLTGAQFTLTDRDADGNIRYVTADSDGTVTYSTTQTVLTSDTNGYFLKNASLPVGTYTLTEISAPSGYMLLSGAITIKLLDDGSIDISGGDRGTTLNYIKTNYVTDDVNHIVTLKIPNLTGTEMPATGGIGTTIFYIVGGVLVVGAGVVLVTKQRMSRRRDRDEEK